jgi:hypothetical protein
MNHEVNAEYAMTAHDKTFYEQKIENQIVFVTEGAPDQHAADITNKRGPSDPAVAGSTLNEWSRRGTL